MNITFDEFVQNIRKWAQLLRDIHDEVEALALVPYEANFVESNNEVRGPNWS